MIKVQCSVFQVKRVAQKLSSSRIFCPTRSGPRLHGLKRETSSLPLWYRRLFWHQASLQSQVTPEISWVTGMYLATCGQCRFSKVDTGLCRVASAKIGVTMNSEDGTGALFWGPDFCPLVAEMSYCRPAPSFQNAVRSFLISLFEVRRRKILSTAVSEALLDSFTAVAPHRHCRI